MHQGDVGAPGSPPPGGESVFPADIECLLARSDTTASATPDELRARRHDLGQALVALSVAGEILSADVAVLRRCLDGDAGSAGGAADARGLLGALPGVLAARPWGRGWSAPPHPAADEDDDPDVVVRSAPLWSSHHVMATVDVSSEAEVTAALARVEEQLVDLCAWRSAVEARLAAVRGAIVAEWSARVDGSLETPA